jgi:hypothetical protein
MKHISNQQTDQASKPTVQAMALALFLTFGTTAMAADGAAPASATGKASAVTLEAIPGSPVKRITLTLKAAERLDIQTGKVTEQVVVRKQMVSGMVIYPQASAGGAAPGAGGPAGLAAKAGGGFGGFGNAAPAAAAAPTSNANVKPIAVTETAAQNAGAVSSPAPVVRGDSWVVVSLSPGEFERINKDKPARITPLYTRDKSMQEMWAPLSDQPLVEDGKRSMLTLRYKLPNADHGLAPSTRVRVELQQAGSEDKQKVVPYNAVYYDAKGQPWVYTNNKPLQYERHKVTVQRVVGGVAVIADGPPVDTPVVIVGAALLYGTEIFGK